MVLYASDLDRTLIYSGKFLKEYNTNCDYSPVEFIDDRVISYMADDVKDKLIDISKNNNIKFCPVTTRSLHEYSRVDLGIKPEYAIVANGGIILNNGEIIKEYRDYILKNMNMSEALMIVKDIEDELTSVDCKVRMIDGCYLFFKTVSETLFDQEVLYLMAKYQNWQFVRQFKKCYVIPKHFSKQIALRWLWNRLDRPYIVASGDSELDLPMLTLANRAVIPKHGTLVKERFVEEGTFADGGITSPLVTMRIVEEEARR